MFREESLAFLGTESEPLRYLLSKMRPADSSIPNRIGPNIYRMSVFSRLEALASDQYIQRENIIFYVLVYPQTAHVRAELSVYILSIQQYHILLPHACSIS